MNEKWFAISIAQLEKKLKTNAASGLSRKAARSAWYRYAPKAETLFIRRKKSVGKMVGALLGDFALIMLLLAAIFAVLFAELYMGITVLALSLISLVVSFVYYYRSERAMEQMALYFLPTAKVIRGGKLYRTTFEHVVPGDVIILEEGDIVCGDARIVTSDNLSVAMRVGRDKYVPLSKQAQGVIAENEKDPRKMLNIVHAGSVIKKGSARAIVYATGRFTYLGALTGGIEELYSDNTPRELKKMRKICSQISLISMLCILPFSAVSLLLSHMSGGNATLSAAFLTALAICASSMAQLSCTVCKVFFIRKIKELISDKNSVAIRTTDAFDKLTDVKYLFMLDGSAVTDGILHFDTAFTAEGEIKSFENYTSTASTLFEMATLYSSAEANSLTLGIRLPDRFKQGLSEFLANGHADGEALKIRCPIRSYAPGTAADPIDRVFYTDTGRQMVLGVAHTADIFSQCSHAIVAGRAQQLTSVGADRLKHTCSMYMAQGKTVLLFTVSPFETSGNAYGKCFIGAVVLREETDIFAAAGITALEKKGVKVISFVGLDPTRLAPEIPVEAHSGVKAYKDEFIKGNYPITYKFGDIGTYYGLDDKDIEQLMSFAHEKGESVAVISFSDRAPRVLEAADVFISCSPLIDVISAKNEEELYTLEVAGAASSSACIQTVKSKADILIQRPDGKKGGITSLINAFSGTEVAHRNLCSFFKYTLCAQFIRLLTVALPMAFGNPILDARHVLFCSFIIDIFALLMFAMDKSPAPSAGARKYRITSIKKQISADKTRMICALTSSLVAILLPMLVGFTGIVGPYLYRVEYLFSAMLWLHLTLIFYTRYNSITRIKEAVKNRLFILLVVGIAVFMILLLVIAPFGLLFEMESNPLAYFVMSFIPSLIFIAMTELMARVSIKE